MRRINKIIIHCSATPPAMDVGVAVIREWHVLGNGWSDIGYHYVIRRDGSLETGRPLEQPGAHTAGHNRDSIGICLAGGVGKDKKTPENNFTQAQWKALERLVRRLAGQYPEAGVYGPRDFAAKACPSFDAKAWWRELTGGGDGQP